MKNILTGKSRTARFASKIYKRMLAGEWFSYADVLADFKNLKSAKELKYSVSADEKEYQDLRKAFYNMRKAIREKCGDGAFIEDGNNRNKRFCYIGENPNPLAEMEHVAYKNGLQDYYRFCQDAAGFIPSSWLEYHLESTLDLFEINKKKNEKHQIIGSSVDRKHKNIEWLPYFYEWIRNKNVLRIAYHEGFQKEATTVIFHPHFIKEFNGRWHIFGHADGKEPHDGFNIPLDRISELPEVIKGVDYAEPKDVVYPDYFDDIVGVTHIEGAEQYDIVIRIHNRYMFGLVDTKPIHKSQETILPYDDRIGYGEVSIRVRPNNEFYGRVLQLGHDLEIVSPEVVREEIAKRIKEMYARYDE